MEKLMHELRSVVVMCGQLAVIEQNKLFGTNGMSSEYKDNNTPLTRFDTDTNEILLNWAEKQDLGYVGEEGNGPTDRELVLYADPLDGSEALLRGMNTFTIIATIMKMDGEYGSPKAAIIHQPLGQRSWVATSNYGTRLFGTYISNKGCPIVTRRAHKEKIKTAICLFPNAGLNFKQISDTIIADSDFDDQQMGGFGIGGGLVASSLIDVTAIAPTAATESAAMSLIVRRAGGVSYDSFGNPLTSFKFGEVRGKPDFELPNGAVFATNQHAANQVLQVVENCNQTKDIPGSVPGSPFFKGPSMVK